MTAFLPIRMFNWLGGLLHVRHIFKRQAKSSVGRTEGGVIPLGGTSARWRKKKRTVVTVSDEIRLAVQRDGYYRRRLREIKKQLARTDLPATTPRKRLRFNTAAESAEEHSGKWRVLSSRVPI